MSPEGRGVARRLGLKNATGVLYYHRALKNYESLNLDDAIADVSEAIFYSRTNADYYATRGLFFIEARRPADAEMDLQYALRLNRRQGLAHYGLGILRFQEGSFDAALEHFEAALKIPGARRAEIYYYRAVTHHLLDHPEQAAEDMDKALQLFPANDKRLKDARTWKREIEGKLPESARKGSRPAAKKPRGKKATGSDGGGTPAKLPPSR